MSFGQCPEISRHSSIWGHASCRDFIDRIPRSPWPSNPHRPKACFAAGLNKVSSTFPQPLHLPHDRCPHTDDICWFWCVCSRLPTVWKTKLQCCSCSVALKFWVVTFLWVMLLLIFLENYLVTLAASAAWTVRMHQEVRRESDTVGKGSGKQVYSYIAWIDFTPQYGI